MALINDGKFMQISSSASVHVCLFELECVCSIKIGILNLHLTCLRIEYSAFLNNEEEETWMETDKSFQSIACDENTIGLNMRHVWENK